jgi:hypothetical protein
MSVYWIRKITYTVGFIGSVSILLAAFFTGLVYSGRSGQSYSALNHFVSELGEMGVAEGASVFNISLIIGGVAFTMFVIGLTLQIKNWWRFPFIMIGVVSGISGTLVGFIPMNNLAPHISVAMTFFNTGWMAVGVFSIYVLRADKPLVPRWFLIPGLFSVFCSIAFLILLRLPHDDLAEMLSSPVNRPIIFPLALFEWLVIISVMIWVLLVSAYLWWSDRTWFIDESPVLKNGLRQ